VFGNVKAYPDVALGPKVINFVRADGAQYPIEGTGIVQIAIHETQMGVGDMWILINLVNPTRVERAGPADNPEDLIAFGEEEFCQIGAVLARDAGDQSFHKYFCLFLTAILQR